MTSEWQPIASAPKDGTHILLHTKYGVMEGWWSEKNFINVGLGWTSFYHECFNADVWMPIPPLS